MKKYILYIIYFFLPSFCIAQNINDRILFFTNREQDRIDTLDGVFDHKVQMNNDDATAKATFIYLDLVDSIEQAIIHSPTYSDQQKSSLMGNLNISLRYIGERNVYLISYYEKVFQQIYHVIKADTGQNLEIELYKNIFASLQVIPYYKNNAIANTFLLDASKVYPDEVFKNYGDYSDQVWAKKLVEETAKNAPLSVKKYLSSYHPIRQVLNSSNDTIVKLILGIYKKYGVKTNAYTLIDGIYNNTFSLEKADSVGSVDLRYLINMLKVRKKSDPFANYSLDNELEYYSLKYVRNVNELHDVSDPKVRFGIVDNLTPAELYTLMVYSENEIFTSTFLGLFDRMITRMAALKGDVLHEQVGYNRFRTFIKLCAGFNTLDRFLKTMDIKARNEMLQNFVSNLEKNRGNLSAPVQVADAFGSIKDSSSLAIIEYSLIKEYARVEYSNNKEGIAIYGLLMTLFKDKAVNQKAFFEKTASKFELPVIDKVSYADLINKDSVNLQLHFFFDDDDGKASFKTYIETFSSAGWTIIRHEKIVEIVSKNKLVKIIANYPESEETGGHEDMIMYCDTSKQSPQIIVHRGHSYYAMKTIDKVNSKTKIVFLGSCGGYNNLNEILDRSPDVQIIATKQIGTMFVNNPLLLQMANNINSRKDIDWIKFWVQLDKSIKSSPSAYDRFADYIPPYKNLGAIFIQAYRRALNK